MKNPIRIIQTINGFAVGRILDGSTEIVLAEQRVFESLESLTKWLAEYYSNV